MDLTIFPFRSKPKAWIINRKPLFKALFERSKNMLKMLPGIAVAIILVFMLIFIFRPDPKNPCPRCQSKNRAEKFFFGKEEMEANREIGNLALKDCKDYGEREICADCGHVFGAADKRGSANN